MLHDGTSARLTVYLSARAVWHHKPAYAEIVHRAHKQGLAGASVLHGIEGYGIHMEIHEDRPSRLRTHGPCAVVIVDAEDPLRAFLDTLEDILSLNGVAVLDHVEIHRRVGTWA
jgi:PII-like signaling protein